VEILKQDVYEALRVVPIHMMITLRHNIEVTVSTIKRVILKELLNSMLHHPISISIVTTYWYGSNS
jgi:hypothetical protein